MKKLVVSGIKIFFLLFFSYINKNFSCECCDECWKNFSTDKKTSRKNIHTKQKKSNYLSIIDKKKEEGEKGEEENKSEEEENKPEEEENKPEEEEHGSNEKEKNDEINNDKYLEEVLESFNNVKIIKGDFFKAQNNYELEKSGTKKNDGVLGEGGFGLVYKIKNKKNKKTFVLKQSVVKEEDLEDIKKEIQNLIRLKDEQNILRIVDVYRQNNFIGNFLENEYSEKDNAVCFYIITEYCQGGDLFDLIIDGKGKYDKNKIAYQIINAVYVCHQKQIAHLDLKPENFFLSDNLNIKLGDFGKSSYFEENTKYDKICWSIGYTSYEVFSGKEYDPFKADLFSLGAILYVLYIKKLLYDIENDVVTKEKIDDNFNKIPERIVSIQDINLKILLTGLLQQFEEARWGWDEILRSEFYKELNEKYKE